MLELGKYLSGPASPTGMDAAPCGHEGGARARGWPAKLGEPVEITEWRRHAEGFSWQTYTFRAGAEAFAVRREPEDGLLAPYDIEGQYRLHEALLRLGGVPVPGLRWLELDPSVLGMPFYVMDLVDGHVPVQWKPDDPIAFPDEAARRFVGEQFVDALAAIHALDWRATGAGRARATRSPTGSGCSTRPCSSRCRCCARRSRGCAANPAELRARRARARRLPDRQLHPGADRRIAAVLDWELAHVGDPVEDIAWANLKLFRGRSSLWSQLLPASDFLARYEARTGLRVDADGAALLHRAVHAARRSSRTCVRAARSRRAAPRPAAGGDGPPVDPRLPPPRDGAGGMMQNSLERLLVGVAAALREDIAPRWRTSSRAGRRWRAPRSSRTSSRACSGAPTTPRR